MEQEIYDIHVPVLIVGGSLVGLSMSLFLSWQGVASLVVEKHPEPARLPRARGLDAHTMELFRMIGLECIMRAAQSPAVGNDEIVRVESLIGREIAHLSEGSLDDLNDATPTAGCRIGQDRLEPILAEQAMKMGGDVRFNTTMLSFEQNEAGVSAVIRENATGYTSRVRADYLIAADGGRSTIRATLGIQTQGPGAIAHSTNVLFEADLREALRGRPIMLCFVSNPRLPDGQGGLMPLDNQLLWNFGTTIHPERGERREDWTDEYCIDLIRIAVGIPDLAVKILPAYPWDPVKVGVWELAARYADRYRERRIFLVGDAAHTVLPTGGLGAGTGIQDAFNLSWKLALVLAGKAGAALLDSYEEERLPVGKLTVEQTLQRYFYRTGTGESTIIETAELLFGFRYRCSTAILCEPGADASPLTQHPRTLHGEPGTRAPHIMLEHAGTSASTIDLCGGKWTLLVGAKGNAWREAARHVASRLGFSLSVLVIGEEWQDVVGVWHEKYGVGATGAVLVRPDNVIAWRTSTIADVQPEQTLEQVMSSLLSLRN